MNDPRSFPKFHHDVPQRYLRRFGTPKPGKVDREEERDGIWAFSRSQGTTYIAAIGRTSGFRHTYADGPVSTFENLWREKRNATIEGAGSSAIQSLINGAQDKPEALAEFLALQDLREEGERVRYIQAVTSLISDARTQHPRPADFRSWCDKRYTVATAEPEENDSWLNQLCAGQDPDPLHLKRLWIQQLDKLTELSIGTYLDHTWKVIKAAPNEFWITTDRPVLSLGRSSQDQPIVLALSARIYYERPPITLFPLSPEFLLIVTEVEGEDILRDQADPSFMAFTNEHLIRGARDLVYSHTNENMVAIHRILQQPPLHAQ